MFKQTKSGSMLVTAAVLALTSALGAQVEGSAEQKPATKPQSEDVSGGTSSFVSQTDALVKIEWINLGYELAGVDGAPKLKGSGAMSVDERAKIILQGAAPSAPAVLFVSLSAQPTPFKGGLLVPAAPSLSIVMTTDALGGITLGVSGSMGVPAGLDLVMQYAVADASAPQGVTLSNALLTYTH